MHTSFFQCLFIFRIIWPIFFGKKHFIFMITKRIIHGKIPCKLCQQLTCSYQSIRFCTYSHVAGRKYHVRGKLSDRLCQPYIVFSVGYPVKIRKKDHPHALWSMNLVHIDLILFDSEFFHIIFQIRSLGKYKPDSSDKVRPLPAWRSPLP